MKTNAQLKLFCAIVVLACAVGSIASTVTTSAQSPEIPPESTEEAPTIRLRASGWIGVNWDEITGAEYYQIQLQGTRTDGSAWEQTIRTTKKYHSYGFITRRHAPANVLQVTARVAAIRSDGSTGVWSATSALFTLPPWSIRPTVSFADSGMLSVQWTAEAGADRYEVWFRGTYADGSTADFKQSVGTTDAPAISQTFEIGTGCDVPSVDKIRARVRAIRDSGTDSIWSSGSVWQQVPRKIVSAGVTVEEAVGRIEVTFPPHADATRYTVQLQEETCAGANIPGTGAAQQAAAVSGDPGLREAFFEVASFNAATAKVTVRIERYNNNALLDRLGWTPRLVLK